MTFWALVYLVAGAGLAADFAMHRPSEPISRRWQFALALIVGLVWPLMLVASLFVERDDNDAAKEDIE